MSEPFIGEIKIISWNFPPKGWAFCNGALLPINQNQALFSIFGTTYGGDGRVNFALPNLQGRVPIHMGQGFTLGQRGGETAHTLTMSEMPAHTHPIKSTNAAGDVANPHNAYPANAAPTQLYSTGSSPTQAVAMNPAMISSIGGSQPHENEQPYTVVNYIVALQGIFPSQN